MSFSLSTYERIAPYAYLKQGRKYWMVYMGNPFCISLRRAPIADFDRETVIADVRHNQEQERERFTKLFPTVEWKDA